MICAPDGGIIDDLIVYRVAPDRFLVVPNASNARGRGRGAARARWRASTPTLDDASLRTSLVAVQGPRARDILAPLTDVDLDALRYYAIARGRGRRTCRAWVARTGYTGEDGFELFVAWDDAPRAVGARSLDGGPAAGLVPCGLGARDTLRLEAGMPLYGNELDRDDHAVRGRPRSRGEARQGRRLRRSRRRWPRRAGAGPRKLLVRPGAAGPRHRPARLPGVRPDGGAEPSGVVTSGTLSPDARPGHRDGLRPAGIARGGTMVEVGIRATRVPAEVVPLPFYRRAR